MQAHPSPMQNGLQSNLWKRTQQYTAWVVLYAFLLITTLPIMPTTPVFAHDMPETCANHSACKGDCHGGACHGQQSTPADLVMTDMDMPNIEVATVVQNSTHQTQLAAPVEGTEKIGCDCGCQGTPDKFEAVLSPHIPTHINFQTTIVAVRSITRLVCVKITRSTPPNIPPPRIA